ncbi:phage tail fiber protein [Proteus mirabilis]|uniref:phage tail fiber protein n=1 Tax=Proteus mirabilis TaxID=584 RepID=UPI00068C0C5F|nr:hypothetical protein [Proteus mirabilis]KAB7716239.1 hypothetical protein GBN12_06410 [Proteus mirabilis]MBG2900389.1 hypothetical protein [Proteus mirabilis]PNO77436.1 hypothetical protein MC76_018095 [Proteus mirabilis]
MIYTTGTVSTVSGSAIVSGTGTKWTVNNPAIRSGTIILIKNGNANFIYMVDRVNSDTELVISQPATFTVKNTSYSINLTEPNSYSDANNRMTAIASDTTYFLRAMDQWMMNNGVVTVELSNGQKVTLDSIKKMQGDISNKADLTLSKTQSFTSAIEATTKLTSKSADGKTSISLTTSNAGGTNIELNSASGYNGIQIPKSSGTIMLVGDYGTGGVGLREPSPVSCFYGSPSTGVPGFPSNGAGWQSTYSGNRRAMLFMDTSGNLLARFSLSNNIVDTETPWRTLWSSNNTTVDSNGFIKRASPIIDINPDGTFTTNDESEGATVTRVAQGEYLIEGVLGFNSDAGWGGVDGGIEIPLDVNKQPLIWVDSKVMEDGSILVRTYHRTHPNAPKFARNDIDGYKDGDPIDIPDGRFISVRVQMPEQSIYNVRMREMEEAQKAEERPQ